MVHKRVAYVLNLSREKKTGTESFQLYNYKDQKKKKKKEKQAEIKPKLIL